MTHSNSSNGWGQQLQIPHEDGSRDCSLLSAGGLYVENTITYTCGADADGNTDNIFLIPGPIEIIRLYGFVRDVTAVADFEEFQLQGWDGANAVALCAVSNLDDIGDESTLIKDAEDAILTELDSAQVRYHEETTNQGVAQNVFGGGAFQDKLSTSTYIRSIYNGSNVNAQIEWHLQYYPLGHDEKVTAV